MDKQNSRYEFYKFAQISGILFTFWNLQFSRADWAADVALTGQLTMQPHGATRLDSNGSVKKTKCDRRIEIQRTTTDSSVPAVLVTGARWQRCAFPAFYGLSGQTRGEVDDDAGVFGLLSSIFYCSSELEMAAVRGGRGRTRQPSDVNRATMCQIGRAHV